MVFEQTYNNIVENFKKGAEKAGITFSFDIKSFLEKNIGDFTFEYYEKRNNEFLEHIKLRDQSTECALYYEPASESLKFVLLKEEKMSDIVNRLDSTMIFCIDGNEYGETRITKEYVNSNGAFGEKYDVEGRRIETTIYNIDDATRQYKKLDSVGMAITNHTPTILFRFDCDLKPTLTVKAQTRGNFFVIDAGDDHIVIPREENITLYSVYYNYMIEKGYFYDFFRNIITK